MIKILQLDNIFDIFSTVNTFVGTFVIFSRPSQLSVWNFDIYILSSQSKLLGHFNRFACDCACYANFNCQLANFPKLFGTFLRPFRNGNFLSVAKVHGRYENRMAAVIAVMRWCRVARAGPCRRRRPQNSPETCNVENALSRGPRQRSVDRYVCYIVFRYVWRRR